MLDRRRFLLSAAGLAAAAALPGCGSGSSTSAAPSPRSSAAGFPRTVRHELGSTTLDAAPSRVVCGTDGSELCSLLALGVRPVGYGQRNDPPRSWLAGLADGIDTYDLSGGETSFERLAAWQPDLLLVQRGFATEETLPRYSDVAPTIATSFIDWRENLRQVAEAVGREDRAAELLGEKQALVEAAAERVRAQAGGARLRAVTAFSDGSVYVLNDASPLGKTAAALGFAPLPKAGNPDEAVDLISLERLTEVDGDVLLVMDFGDGDGSDALKSSALWSSLGVVRANRVVDVTGDDAQALYFDAVLTVEPNAAYLERVATTL